MGIDAILDVAEECEADLDAAGGRVVP